LLVFEELVESGLCLVRGRPGWGALSGKQAGSEVIAEVGSFFVAHPFRLSFAAFIVVLGIIVPAILAGM
jgi:hypothetical protein